ncbi:MAG: hypothetical protein ACXVAX_09675 [Pseudobdellovibrio sp.]
MKTMILAVILLVTSTQSFAADKCRGLALSAAEDAYSNYIHKTIVKTIIPGRQYLVTVGIGNVEDGAHTYRVTFNNGCVDEKSVSQVCDIDELGYSPSADCNN